MNINLNKMIIINFKGIKRLEVDFQQVTNIMGHNATFKSSIFDAFTWCLFGKDSHDSATFNIKPLDNNGKPNEKTENEVQVFLTVDGRKVWLKKIHKEKWVKKRGEQLAVFEGNEKLYYWNDVPLQEKDYQSKINDIVNEGIFKMITNTLFFNQKMTWVDRRGVLMSIAGTITNEEIAAGNPEYDALIDVLTHKSLVEYKKEISAKKKKIKDDLILIPARVDEINRGLPEEPNYSVVKMSIEEKEMQIVDIDQEITNTSDAHKAKYAKIKEQLKEIHDLKTRRDAIAYEIKDSENKRINEYASLIKSKKQEIASVDRDLKINEQQLAELTKRKGVLEVHIPALRKQWDNENSATLVFDEHEFTCPTCKRDFEADDIEAKKAEMLKNFTASKKTKLLKISESGKSLSAENKECENKIDELEAETKTLNEFKGELNDQLKTLELNAGEPVKFEEFTFLKNPEYAALTTQIKTLEAAKEEEPKVDNTVFIFQKNEIRAEIDALKKQLSIKDQIEKAKLRIEELQEEEQNLAQQLADLERTEFLITKFTAAKIDEMEARINNKFQLVRFKMFNQLNNGGVEECCETTINGVPFSDLNTASKINAGIDIINVLCAHYDVHAPIFVDNRESTVDIIPCDSQIINLKVVEGMPLTIDGVRVGRNSKELAA